MKKNKKSSLDKKISKRKKEIISSSQEKNYIELEKLLYNNIKINGIILSLRNSFDAMKKSKK